MSERVLTRRWQVAIRLPVGACLAVAIALWHRRRHAAARSGPVAWAAVGVLAIESILAITSLGAFLLPAVVLVLFDSEHFSLLAALIVAAVAVIVFRGLVEVITRKLIPSPSLYGADQSLKEADIVARRRYWFWRGKFRRLPIFAGAVLALLALCQVLFSFSGVSSSFFDPFSGLRQIFPPD